eukprot:CAMPEP_0175050242 /NCGR_PEP_ID=MMETSP0052_2-20121109/7157_1 /TAXON_ID=51329 ORGANISM="Polytomella parva, Strain SAG 63-3" /NCGR_SAMPLE_ID=MMETSP0052_2 /ASSEMBLY_ACC=CAM_ASM_000194 /LENGTH=612 /DNA_ID=CAMNT_0016314437 /DNA_START=29 /DNA_END=1867 /DNA_ORIENTATION=-
MGGSSDVGENGVSHHGYLIICYVMAVFCIVSFAIYAIIRHTYYLTRVKHRDQNTEEFITARHTQHKWRIAWSFFASAVGAWCIAGPSQFAYYTGIIGLLMYAISAGFPLLVLSICGAYLQAKYPHVCTVGDYSGVRFGPTLRGFVVAIVLLAMSIGMLAEFIAMGAIFRDFVGSVDYPIIITVGIITLCYTAYGGLYVSIITDQVQGVLTILLVIILSIYTAVKFRPPRCASSDDWYNYADPPLAPCMPSRIPDQLRPNKLGYSAIYSMPCSLLAATIFSESLWQKVWASKDRKALIFGGAMSSLGVTVVVFLFGLGGWLAAWGGYVNGNYTNMNLLLFQVFASEQTDNLEESSAHVRSWVGVITVMVAAVMNESAIDSYQNGLTAAFTQHFFPKQSTFFARWCVIAINVPLMIISFQGYPILALYVLSNMLTTCGFIPLLLGLWDGGKEFITESSVLSGFTCAMLVSTAYGIGKHWDSSNPRGSIAKGARYTWYDNVNYDWDYFLVASCFSVVGMIAWIVPAQILKYFGIKGWSFTQIFCHIPGFYFLTGSGFDYDLMDTRCMRPIARIVRYDYSQSPFNNPEATEPDIPAVLVTPAKGATVTAEVAVSKE